MKGSLRDAQARLERAAESYRFAVEEREEGTVLSSADGIAAVSGLRRACLMELLETGGGARGLAMDLREHELGMVLLDGARELRVGDRVRATGGVASVPVGPGLLGRVVDPLGRPLDGAGAVRAEAQWPLERPAPGIAERQPVTEPLFTGLTVIDALFPIGRGQRQLILGDRGTGKSTIATDAVIHQKQHGTKCVYVTVGQTTASVVSLLETLRQERALDNTIVVVARADDPPGVRFVAPYAGCTLAEYFRDRGDDALVVFDDLSAHAVAYRELSLLLRRPAGREAYPGDIFFIHSRLLERATRLHRDLGGGSLTALPIVETQAGRISDFIPTNVISITDGQLYLDPRLFDRGFKPAVDIGISVSRVGGRTQRPSMRAVAGKLRLDLARFSELEVFTRFGARIEEETQRLLAHGARARELLKQAPGARLSHGEQVALLLALEEGLFEPRSLDELAGARGALLARLPGAAPEVLAALDRGSVPTESDRGAIRDLLGPGGAG